MCGKSNDMWSKMRILKINLRESMNVIRSTTRITLEEILTKNDFVLITTCVNIK